MKTLIDIFNLGMYRNYPDVLPDREGCILNLGAGEKTIDGAAPLEYPEYDFEKDQIPYRNNTVDMIHCYHFLEHIANTSWIMFEIERVLKPGAHINIVVPYYSSQIMWVDPDHKRAFTERTWDSLFDHTRYEKGKIKRMEICTNFIMGESERNIVLVTQLRKIK